MEHFCGTCEINIKYYSNILKPKKYLRNSYTLSYDLNGLEVVDFSNICDTNIKYHREHSKTIKHRENIRSVPKNILNKMDAVVPYLK